MYAERLNDNLSILYSEIVNFRKTRFDTTKKYIQHGKTSVYKHSVSVAYASCVIVARLNLNVDVRKMVRGALLHDYFLYDWHEKDKTHRLHGFTHPRRSLVNAMADFKLSATEQDIIVKHMFPLTVVPPVYKEGWVVTFADKYCSLRETFA